MVLSIGHVRLKESGVRINENKSWQGQLFIKPDRIDINGNFLKIEGEVVSKKRSRKQKVMAFYRIETEKELKEWQTIDDFLVVSVSGQVESLLSKTNLNGFDYQKYLKQKGIYQVLQIEKIIQVQKEPIQFKNLIYYFSIVRKKSINYCNTKFLKETAMYFNTLLFGFKSNSFLQKQDILADMGILHLFTLSGMHVAFCISKFRFFFLKLGLTAEKVFWLEVVFCLFYAGITGNSISIIRALLQSNIKLFNQRFNYGLSQLDCWSCTLLICLLCSPYTLYSVGGQLSFGLSFFILFIQPIVKKIKQILVQRFCFSLLLSIMTIPIVGVSFFEWQPTSNVFTFFLMPFFEKILLPAISLSFIASFFFPTTYYNEIVENFFFYLKL